MRRSILMALGVALLAAPAVEAAVFEVTLTGREVIGIDRAPGREVTGGGTIAIDGALLAANAGGLIDPTLPGVVIDLVLEGLAFDGVFDPLDEAIRVDPDGRGIAFETLLNSDFDITAAVPEAVGDGLGAAAPVNTVLRLRTGDGGVSGTFTTAEFAPDREIVGSFALQPIPVPASGLLLGGLLGGLALWRRHVAATG